MSLEQKINYQLNKYPGIKRIVKSVYQHAMYAISPKIKSEGNITRLSPDDANHEYFFGYYDKCPWDRTDRYVLCLKADDTWSDVSPKAKADILLIDTGLPENDGNRVKKIAETRAWNVQQSCMLQWMGPDFSSRILFNDYRNGRYVAVIKELKSGAEHVINAPVYTVSADGRTALTLDFSRLYNLRPGYGYYNVPEKTKGIALPDDTAVWKIDLESGDITPLLSYKNFATFQPRSEMQEKGAVHKVNHLMLSPNGKRFMVLYRWFVGERKFTRLVTCNIDGTGMYVLSDDDMVSHCFWKDDEHILAFENKKDGGTGYYLMRDKTKEYQHCWPELTGDGHPSYSPDRRHIVTDSYPDRVRIQYLYVMKDERSKPDIVARVFSPFKYDNDTRCDLHPRWNHAGDMVCFDSVYEGHRGLYMVKTEHIVKEVNPRNKSEWVNEFKHYATKKALKAGLHIFWIFPIKKNRITLINEQSFLYGDNVKYINEYINEKYDGKYEVIFPVKAGTELAPNAIWVKPMSIAYFKYLLTSRAVITNCGGISYLPKRKHQLFINTWHGGGAYKKVGIDVWDSFYKRKEEELNSSNTDYLCCSCEAFARYEAPPMFFKPYQCVNTGMPRNDIFFKQNKKIRAKVYNALKIDESNHLIVYAPTYRSDTTSFANEKTSRDIDLDYKKVIDAFETKMGGEWRFGIRLHPRIGEKSFSDTVIVNCTMYPDMQELLYACDAVITDYSSLMWDFALTKKPCFIYAPDIEEYENNRGFYISTSEWPFPIAKTNKELIDNIIHFDEEMYREAVEKHLKIMGSYEDGLASWRVMELVNRG